MVFSEHDEKYLNREGMDYLIGRLKEKLYQGGPTDLSDYYTREEIDALLDGIQQGTDGEDGITPHIGDNGNWYIGDADTGVKAQGTDGKDGADGQDGYTPVKGVDYFDGADGADGKDGANGTDGKDGTNGADGVSPTVTENAENSDTVYKLDIADAAHAFTTPNLKGQDGADGSGGNVDLANYYTKAEVDGLIPDISGKADAGHKHTLSDITDYAAADLSGYSTTEQVQAMIDDAIGGAINGEY